VVFVDSLKAAALRPKVIHWRIRWFDAMERAQKH